MMSMVRSVSYERGITIQAMRNLEAVRQRNKYSCLSHTQLQAGMNCYTNTPFRSAQHNNVYIYIAALSLYEYEFLQAAAPSVDIGTLTTASSYAGGGVELSSAVAVALTSIRITRSFPVSDVD
jgi:hypothetical protein